MPFTIQNKVLLVRSHRFNKGGVASFYNGVLPHFPAGRVTPLEIGGSRKTGGKLHPVTDQFRFRSALKNKQPSLVHLNPSLNFKSFIRDGLFAWQAKQMGLPLLVFWHGWNKDFEITAEQKYLGFFHRTFGRADAHIVLASEFERKLRQWGVQAPVYRETTNVDESLLSKFTILDKWPEQEVLERKNTRILFLARLERAKGIFETVQAVKLLIDKALPVSLTIAGDGNIRQELEDFIRFQGLNSQQVAFTGDIRGADKIRAFTEHHIYCFPTFYGEGLPNSVLEAMAFGLPVVTRPVGGLADMFVDGKMGRLVQGKSPVEIASCLEELVTDQDRMAQIGRYNAAYAKEHFMASKVAARLLGIYDKVLNDQA